MLRDTVLLVEDDDGRDVCLALRARGTTAPVLFLTARSAVVDLLSGFAAGGDDYLTKPFHVAELLARMRSDDAADAVTGGISRVTKASLLA